MKIKITSKKTRTTTIFDDGTSCEFVKKTVIVDVGELSTDNAHDAIVNALRDTKTQLQSELYTDLP